MIILDTHVLVWWVHGGERLTEKQIQSIRSAESEEIGISAISLWEIAKLVERKRLVLPLPIKSSLRPPGCLIVPLLRLTHAFWHILTSKLFIETQRDPRRLPYRGTAVPEMSGAADRIAVPLHLPP